MAVGFSVSSAGQLPLVEFWNGSDWAIQTAPMPPGATSGALLGVSCLSATDCTAVGEYDLAPIGYQPRTLAESWNGSSWSIQPTPNPTPSGGAALSAVWCGSPTFCTAVGSYDSPSGGFALAESWNGSSWSIQPTPNPTGSTFNSLANVSCSPSATFCTAVGERYGGSTGDSALAESWNGTSWNVEPTPLPTGATASRFSDVSCTSAAACTAVGEYSTDADGASSVVLTMAEHWDGTRWTVQATPDPPLAYTADATSITSSSATLNGVVDPNGATVTNCHFEYGTTTSLGSSMPCAQSVGDGTLPVAVSAKLSGLTPNTTYYMSVVASNAGGTARFPDDYVFSFTTSTSDNGTGGGGSVVTSPDYKVVQYIRDFKKSPENLEACGPDLMSSLGISLKRASAICLLLEDSHNPTPPADLSGTAWARFVSSHEYRGFIHLPPVTVGCRTGAITSVNTRANEFEQSPGYSPSPITRTPYLDADYYDGPSFLPLPWPARYQEPNPSVTRDGNSVIVSYAAASRIAGLGRLGNLFITAGIDAPFIWDRIVEKVSCGGYTTLFYVSAFPAVTLYANGHEFAYANQDPRLGRFILSGGPGGVAGITPGPIHKQGQGYFFPNCNIWGDPDNATSYPIDGFTPGLANMRSCGVQPLANPSFGGGGYIAPSQTATIRKGAVTVTVTTKQRGLAMAWLVQPRPARTSRRGAGQRRGTAVIASGRARVTHRGHNRIKMHLTRYGRSLLKRHRSLRTEIHGVLVTPRGGIERMRTGRVKLSH